jgi:hypothetical protein
MTRARLVLPAAAAGGAALLLLPSGGAWTIAGPALGLDATHVRVFNNFADPEANDHQVPHDQFPGGAGAALAIWKASVEWGAALHGTGAGDPTQPGDLGSGGSNVSPSWQAAAAGVGAIGDNVHSAAASLPGGVIAVTEVGGGGWRIRYNDQYLWDDDPLAPAPGAIDLQSVATHEYGHALGLGHTSVTGCVMSPTAGATGIARALCPDDQAGLQALYGAASASKPAVELVLVDAAGGVSIHGSGFAAIGNEVWFTEAGPTGAGPVKVIGVVATAGGTRIDVTLPAAAGPGDVLVHAAGAGLATLSNAWPIDLPGGVSCGVLAYGVGLGGANLAELDTADVPAVGATLALQLEGFQVDGPALTLISAASAHLPLFGGVVLVDPGAVLAAPLTGVTGGAGVQVVPIPADPSLAGARVYAQAGQVDPGAPAGVALSNGLEIVVCP